MWAKGPRRVEDKNTYMHARRAAYNHANLQSFRALFYAYT